MGFSRKLVYYLVHQLKMTNAEAKHKLVSGQVWVDGVQVMHNDVLPEHAEVRINDVVVRTATTSLYLKFYKPRGYQSSLNENVPNNLAAFFKEWPGLAIAGRLDKDSEGLLLLSNDGKWIESICHPSFEKEKEYLVQLDREPDAQFLQTFSGGMNIGTHHTAPCFCERVDTCTIRVILTEGKNRQIRRMVHRLGYQVKSLKRVRIGTIELGALSPGELTAFSQS